MTISIFVGLLAVFSTLTSMITELVKKSLKEKEKDYASNLVVLIVSAIIGILGTTAFYILKGIVFDVNNVICIAIMVVAVWLSSMLGYDKIKQLIEQLGKL